MAAFNRANLTWWQRNSGNVYTALFVNTPRSFAASLLSTLETVAAGAQLQAAGDNGTVGAGQNKQCRALVSGSARSF